MSLSARRAWIEIANFCRNRFCPTVALRKESVDRNRYVRCVESFYTTVALRKESVDRNSTELANIRACILSLSARRAWIEIDVEAATGLFTASLSARRAWIEMQGSVTGY